MGACAAASLLSYIPFVDPSKLSPNFGNQFFFLLAFRVIVLVQTMLMRDNFQHVATADNEGGGEQQTHDGTMHAPADNGRRCWRGLGFSLGRAYHPKSQAGWVEDP